jgi:hypothetical protein
VPQLDGIKLFWSRTIEPLDLNFVQYRRVKNVTTTVTGTDLTPFTTLSIGFESTSDHQVLVPSSYLQAGETYEFRFGFPNVDYTYFTNSMLATTLGARSNLVSHVLQLSTATSIELAWDAPEYSDGVTGYQVSLWFQEIGNADVSNPTWDVDQRILFGRQSISSGVHRVFFGCSDEQTVGDCLTPYTHYLAEIAVIRDSVVETPFSLYLATKQLVRDRVEMFSHSGDIFVVFLRDQPVVYSAITPIEDTIFSNASLTTEYKEFYLSLRNSTVQSLSPSMFHLRLSDADYHFVLETVVYSGAVYSERVFIYGRDVQVTLPVIGYCK